MNRRFVLATLAGFSIWALAPLPTPALAQTDPATQRLIDQLRPRMGPPGATRGLVRPNQGGVAQDAGTPDIAPPAASAASPATPARTAPRIPPAPPTTTAAPDTPAASITVNFGSGSAVLAPGAFAPLNALGRALTSTELASSRFRIEGHTDTVGTEAENLDLSERRAKAVRDYLVERFRVDPGRLVIQGLGEGQLLIRTPDETSQPQNRRVQVINIGS